MDTLEIPELLAGIKNVAMKNYKQAIIELLTNKVADNLETLSEEDAKNIIITAVNQLQIKEKNSAIINTYLVLLSNLTVPVKFCETFMALLESDEALYKNFRVIIEDFLINNPQLETDVGNDSEWITADPWQFTASILSNLCQIESGRKLILQQTHNYLPRIVHQIRSHNATRRRGSVSCLRSCLFDNDIHWWIMYEVKALPYILMPLVDPTPFTDKEKEGMDPTLWLQAENPDKKVEPHQDIMKMLLECIILLCQRRGIREELRKRKAYYVCRNLDQKIEVEEINETVYEIVNLLIMDEDPTVPVDTYDNQAVWKGDAPDEFAQRALTAGGGDDEGVKKGVETEMSTEVDVAKVAGGKEVGNKVETVFNSPAPSADASEADHGSTVEHFAAAVEIASKYDECD